MVEKVHNPPPPPALSVLIAAAVKRLGAREVARVLELDEMSVLRLATQQPVRRCTIAVASFRASLLDREAA